MEVILLERIEKLGQMGDVVQVKPGYARNYLLPQKKALRATKGNLEGFETHRGQLEADNLKRRDEAEAVAKTMQGLTVTLIRQAGDSGQLYGSVTARDIAAAVSEAGFTVDRGQVQQDRPIKALGMHPARVALHPEVDVIVTANVAQSDEEAEAQLRHAAAGEEPIATGEAADVFADATAGEVPEDAAAEDEAGASAETSTKTDGETDGAPDADSATETADGEPEKAE